METYYKSAKFIYLLIIIYVLTFIQAQIAVPTYHQLQRLYIKLALGQRERCKYYDRWGQKSVQVIFIGTVLVLVLKNERFVKFFIPILSQVIGTIKYSKIPSFCCCSY